MSIVTRFHTQNPFEKEQDKWYQKQRENSLMGKTLLDVAPSMKSYTYSLYDLLSQVVPTDGDLYEMAQHILKKMHHVEGMLGRKPSPIDLDNYYDMQSLTDQYIDTYKVPAEEIGHYAGYAYGGKYSVGKQYLLDVTDATIVNRTLTYLEYADMLGLLYPENEQEDRLLTSFFAFDALEAFGNDPSQRAGLYGKRDEMNIQRGFRAYNSRLPLPRSYYYTRDMDHIDPSISTDLEPSTNWGVLEVWGIGTHGSELTGYRHACCNQDYGSDGCWISYLNNDNREIIPYSVQLDRAEWKDVAFDNGNEVGKFFVERIRRGTAFLKETYYESLHQSISAGVIALQDALGSATSQWLQSYKEEIQEDAEKVSLGPYAFMSEIDKRRLRLIVQDIESYNKIQSMPPRPLGTDEDYALYTAEFIFNTPLARKLNADDDNIFDRLMAVTAEGTTVRLISSKWKWEEIREKVVEPLQNADPQWELEEDFSQSLDDLRTAKLEVTEAFDQLYADANIQRYLEQYQEYKKIGFEDGTLDNLGKDWSILQLQVDKIKTAMNRQWIPALNQRLRDYASGSSFTKIPDFGDNIKLTADLIARLKSKESKVANDTALKGLEERLVEKRRQEEEERRKRQAEQQLQQMRQSLDKVKELWGYIEEAVKNAADALKSKKYATATELANRAIQDIQKAETANQRFAEVAAKGFVDSDSAPYLELVKDAEKYGGFIQKQAGDANTILNDAAEARKKEEESAERKRQRKKTPPKETRPKAKEILKFANIEKDADLVKFRAYIQNDYSAVKENNPEIYEELEKMGDDFPPEFGTLDDFSVGADRDASAAAWVLLVLYAKTKKKAYLDRAYIAKNIATADISEWKSPERDINPGKKLQEIIEISKGIKDNGDRARNKLEAAIDLLKQGSFSTASTDLAAARESIVITQSSYDSFVEAIKGLKIEALTEDQAKEYDNAKNTAEQYNQDVTVNLIEEIDVNIAKAKEERKRKEEEEAAERKRKEEEEERKRKEEIALKSPPQEGFTTDEQGVIDEMEQLWNIENLATDQDLKDIHNYVINGYGPLEFASDEAYAYLKQLWRENSVVAEEFGDLKDFKVGQNLKMSAAAWVLLAKYAMSPVPENEVYLRNAFRAKIRSGAPWKKFSRRLALRSEIPNTMRISIKKPDPAKYYTPISSEQLDTSAGFRWKGNSCWIDTSMMMLFKIPGLWLERYIRDPKNNNIWVQSGCGQENAQNLYNDLLNDIDFIQGNPDEKQASPSKTVCQLTKSFKDCIIPPGLEAYTENYKNTLALGLLSFRSMFQLETQIQLFSTQEDGTTYIQRELVTNDVEIIIVEALHSEEQKQYQKWDGFDGEFVLHSVALYDVNHYLAAFKTPHDGQWRLFNDHYITGFDATKQFRIDVRELGSDAVLNQDGIAPLYAPKEIETGEVDLQKRSTIFQPVAWVYIRSNDPELERLRNLPSAEELNKRITNAINNSGVESATDTLEELKSVSLGEADTSTKRIIYPAIVELSKRLVEVESLQTKQMMLMSINNLVAKIYEWNSESLQLEESAALEGYIQAYRDYIQSLLPPPSE